MSSLVVLAQLKAKDGKSRNKVIEALTKVMQYSQKNEANVYKYTINIPQDETDEQSVYVLEEYANKAAFESHMAAPVLQELTKLFASEPLLSGTPEVFNLDPLHMFSRPEANQHTNPHIVLGRLDYKPGTVSQSFPYWKVVFQTTKADEQGSLLYCVCRVDGFPNRLQTIEVYESSEYLWDIHAKSNAVQENIKNTGHLRENLKLTPLKFCAGYWHK